MSKLDEFIDDVTTRARHIADGSGSPSELGVEIWSLALETHGQEVNAVSGPIWLIWGTLTDPVDWPGRESEIAKAEAEIRRAAEEWLVVAHDRPARQEYLDRWLYAELGFAYQGDWSDY